MKDAYGRKQKSDLFSMVVKTGLIASALGLIVLVVDKSHVTPEEVHANAANTAAAAIDARQTSASESADATTAPTAAAETGVAGPTSGMTSEPSESSSSRED